MYIPSSTEKFILENAADLGFSETNAKGCSIWNDPKATSPEIYAGLTSYAVDLDRYNQAVNDFAPIPDLLKSIQQTGSHEVCADASRPHPDGIQALFPSDQLSISKSGFVEPLYPPMRSEKICGNISKHLMDMTYLVHDFEAMCRKLKPWSKRILIDMGASLEFHKDSGHGSTQPIVTLVDQYEKFGFAFDHIYGFEITFIEPEKVYETLPEKFMPMYHWINVDKLLEFYKTHTNHLMQLPVKNTSSF